GGLGAVRPAGHHRRARVGVLAEHFGAPGAFLLQVAGAANGPGDGAVLAVGPKPEGAARDLGGRAGLGVEVADLLVGVRFQPCAAADLYVALGGEGLRGGRDHAALGDPGGAGEGVVAPKTPGARASLGYTPRAADVAGEAC